MQNIDVTFFVPCLNEQDNIINTINTILSAVKKLNITYEILIIDDASTDKTKEIIGSFIKQNPSLNIKTKYNETTKGLGYNYIEGAYIGSGKHYMLVNGDNSEPEETLLTILKNLGKADLIIPYFGPYDKRSFLRKLISFIFNRTVNIISGYKLHYFNGPVLHIRENVMRWHPITHGFAYQAELICLLLDQKKSYIEVVVPNVDRVYGITKAFNFKNFCSVAHSLLEISIRRLRKILWK